MSELTGKALGLTSVRGRLLLPKEVATFLRISERTIEDRMKKGTFPIRWYPLGVKNRMVDSEDLNDYLKKVMAEAGKAVLPDTAIKKIVKQEVKA